MNPLYALPVVGAAIAFGGILWYRKRQRQRAQIPKCPICRSRQLDGIDGHDDEPELAIHGDEFRCLDCGLAYEDLDPETRRRVDALIELQKLEYPVLRARQEWYQEYLTSGDDSIQMFGSSFDDSFERTTRRLMEVWKQLQQIREEYPEAFEAPLPEGSEEATAGELVAKNLQGESTPGILQKVGQFVPSVHVATESYSAGDAIERIREAIAAEVDQRRAA